MKNAEQSRIQKINEAFGIKPIREALSDASIKKFLDQIEHPDDMISLLDGIIDLVEADAKNVGYSGQPVKDFREKILGAITAWKKMGT
jgi:hypothetical protein